MKYLVFLIALLAHNVCAQNAVIQRVPGTKVCLIVPEGFKRISKMAAFVHPDLRASISVMETRSPFNGAIAIFNPDRLLNDGIEVLLRDTIDFNGMRALRLKLRPQGKGIKNVRNILLFGDDTYAVMIDGIYADTSALEHAIETSLFTAVYHKTLIVDPQEGIKFQVRPESEGFTFISLFCGELTYIITDSTREPRDYDPAFVVNSASNLDSISDFRQYAIDMLVKTSGAKQYTIATIDTVVVDELHGFEVTAYDVEKQVLLYEMILYPNAQSYYLMTGRATRETNLFFEKYRNVARTFRRK
jgi:hypothetical protein